VLPFSKRPPSPEEYLLRSGDFEAVDPHAIPAAPRAPVFARSNAPTPYGFVQHYAPPHPPHPAHGPQHGYPYANGMDVPPPPHSLAPVAMGGAAGVGTGSHRFQPTLPAREKPSLKWGVLIAVSGAVLGGVLGIGMDAKRQHAASAAQAEAAAAMPMTQAMVAATAQPVMAPVAPQPVVTQIAAPRVLTAAPQPAAAPATPGVVLPPQAPVVVAAAPVAANAATKDGAKGAKHDKAEKPAAHTRPAARPTPHTNMLSTKVTRPAPEPEPVAEVKKPEPKKAETKPEPKSEPKSEKAEAKKGGASKTDAEKILADAIKDTTNTL